MLRLLVFACSLVFICASVQRSSAQPLPGTAPLTQEGDLAAQMVAGIDRYLMRATEEAARNRERFWKRDLSSPEAYARSVEPNRQSLTKKLGLVDKRVPPSMEIIGWQDPKTGRSETIIERRQGYKIYAVRWPVFRGITGEGLLLQPDRKPVADVVALPDCDNTPEQLAGLVPGLRTGMDTARQLAEAGCRVIVPTLIDRRDEFAGIQGIRMTNQPHREFIWRAAYEVGRTPIGYDVQRVRAAIDVLKYQGGEGRPLGLVGYCEGGLIALYTAAVDTRVDAAFVSGYFGEREALWSEPIYRNVFGLLTEFGDAEIASLIAPRALIVQAAEPRKVDGPPAPQPGRGGAAPGRIASPSGVETEMERARRLAGSQGTRLRMTADSGCGELLAALGTQKAKTAGSSAGIVNPTSYPPTARERHQRQFEQTLEDTQVLMRESPNRRAEFWAKADASSPEKWAETSKAYREQFWDDVIGRLPPATLPPNARTRLVYDTPKLRGYEVMLDLYPDVYAYGILLLPKDLKPGERRPVVVCQHGLEGRPQDVADPAVDSPYYHRFAVQLAERGFITYAPQNPYIGEDKFRVLLRKAQPLGKTLFSFIVRQHERTLEWLSTLPMVDKERIGFYGLSYGGKTAMRVPAVLPQYKLSICSADYNEWIWKVTSASSPYSYLITNEYDMPEWNIANTYNYAEMSHLICPRPFMVERGHQDGVAPDEWIGYEFAKTRRRYDLLGIGDRVELEVFNGPHTIHGVGTFDFLHKHLNWPNRQ